MHPILCVACIVMCLLYIYVSYIMCGLHGDVSVIYMCHISTIYVSYIMCGLHDDVSVLYMCHILCLACIVMCL